MEELKSTNYSFMMKNKNLFAVFIVQAIVCTTAVSQNGTERFSLKQCVEAALANNLSIRQTALQVETAETNLQQAKANKLPNLNGSIDYGFSQGRTVNPQTNGYINQQLTSSNTGLSSGVTLFNGMRLQNIIKQNSYNWDAAKMDWQQAKDNLILNVILAYLQVLNSEDVLEIAANQLNVTKKQIERTAILVKEGAAANYVLADFKAQQANEEINLINLKATAGQSKFSLCQLMNNEPDNKLQLERINLEQFLVLYPSGPKEVYEIALKGLAQVKAEEFKIQSAEKTVTVAKSASIPLLRLNGSLGSNYSSLGKALTPTTITEVSTGNYVKISGTPNPVLTLQQNYSSAKTGYVRQLNNNLGTFIGLSLQIPLFNNNQTKNNIRLANTALKNNRLEADNTKAQLRQDIELAYLNCTSAFEKYLVLKEQISNIEESFRAAEIRFANGVINTTEYLTVKNNLDRVKINLTQMKYEYIFRAKILDFYQGQLTY